MPRRITSVLKMLGGNINHRLVANINHRRVLVEMLIENGLTAECRADSKK